MALSTGDKLGPYEILSAIGAGGMGEVYKARDTRLDRTVAIKVLPEHIAKREDLRVETGPTPHQGNRAARTPMKASTQRIRPIAIRLLLTAVGLTLWFWTQSLTRPVGHLEYFLRIVGQGYFRMRVQEF